VRRVTVLGQLTKSRTALRTPSKLTRYRSLGSGVGWALATFDPALRRAVEAVGVPMANPVV
jgi:hypothetical protein